jgi:hypothetical protein
MKKLIALSAIAILAGCSTFKVSDDSVTTTTTEKFGVTTTVVTEHEVDVWRGNVFMNASVEMANIEYGEVKVNIGNFQQAGDYKSIEAVGNAITSGIIAWFTYGTAPAVKAAVSSALKASETNSVVGACSPATK